jgi:integrase
MSCSVAKGGWEVRWRDSSGRQRSQRFTSEEAAREFDGSMHEQKRVERRDRQRHSGGVYPYSTANATRWRFVYRRSDGTQTTKRGFPSEKAARDARRRLVEKIERGEIRHTKESFEAFWTRWLARRKAYLEPGTWEGYEIQGRKRLIPALGAIQLGRLGIEDIRIFVDELAESVDAGELAPKTVNNTLGTLVVCLNDAVEDRLIASNPALRVQRLPPAHVETEYLRLHEIATYLDACTELYRPVAEALIGSGLRISEALALQVSDLELEESGGVIIVYRSRKKKSIGSTKSDRFRSVEIGPGLSRTLGDHLARRAEMAAGDQRNSPVFVMPQREQKRDRGRWPGHGVGEPMDRTTVSRDWHKLTLEDAGLRDMPLHALRHTAAAAWLAAGNSLMYVQRQLGHADIATTERYYGHLERHVLAAGALATEKIIAGAARPARRTRR